MLQETVEFLKQFREASAGTVSVYTCRTFLCKLVENFLTDLNKVSTALQKDGSHIEYFNALHFCGIFLRDKSEVFLPPPPNQSPATPPLHRSENISQEDDFTYEFLRWFLSRILVLLGHKRCELMHEQTLKTVHELLQAVKYRDAFMYGKIMEELVTCVIDLAPISDSMFKETLPITGEWSLDVFDVNMDLVLKSLLEPSQRNNGSDVQLSKARFIVDDIYCCELLQINFTKILCGVAKDINNFCLESKVNTLWAGLCYQLEAGDVIMKTESLRLLSALLRNITIPLEEEEYLKECLSSLIELLSTGLVLVEDLKIEDRESFEKVTADLIYSLFDHSYRNTDNQSILKYFFFKMADIFDTNGFSKLLTKELKISISFVLSEIQTKLSCDYLVSSVCKSQRSQMISSMVNEIGYSTDLQYLIPPIVKAIVCDLSVKTWNNSDKVTDKVVTEPATSTKTASKRTLDGSLKPNIKSQSLSGTYKMIRSKLDDILRQGAEFQDDVKVKICGVETIIEIISSCVQLYSLKESEAGKHKYASEFSSLGSWLDSDCFKEVCGYLYCVLQYLMTSQKPVDDVNTCFKSCVKIVGALLNLHGNSEYDNDTLQLYGWIASLPWLLNDPSWIDLKPVNARDIVKIANYLSPILDRVSLCECLKVLALLPKEVCSKWRIHVFRQALCDNILDIKITAVDVFPVLLYHLGPNANHLVYDLLHPSLDEKSVDLHKSLAVISGPLACVVSRKAVLKKSSTVSVYKPMYQQNYISCLSCDQSTCTNISGSPIERPKLVDANMFLPFVQLVNSDKHEVKIGLVNSMRLIFGHISVRKNNTATINILNTALTLIEDTDYDTRTLFSEVIQYLLGKDINDGCDGTNELVLTKLREAFYKAKSDGHVRQQETVLLTIAQLGRVSEGELLVVVIIVLLESMLSPTPLVAAVAHEQLKDIAEYKKTKTQNLFMKCRHDVCKFLVEAMHDAQCGKINKTAEEILIEVSQVLEYSDLKTFLTGIEKFIVPFLVSKGTSAASNLIKLIATQLSVASRSKLLITNTKHVFSYLVRYKPKDSDLQSAINYLQKETKFELRDLLRIDFQRVHNELLLHLSTNYSEVFRGLKILSSCDAQFKGEISTSQEMADYLQPRLLGVLAFFDSQLLKPSIPMEEKRPALESLISIIRLMGSKNISAIRHKVMNTLRIGLQFTDNVFVELSCRAWNCFVRSLELSFLGQMLPTIVATLLPLLKLLPKQVAEIFNYMIVENRAVLKDHFHDIYFLPDMPELNDANAVLKQYTDGPSSSQSDFTGQLEHTMKGIQHESLDIRLHALSKLKKLLKEKRKAFLQLVMESESASPLVSKLISVLLKGCREPDPQAQRLYTECLGICGAIDPGRLELSANNPKAELANLQVNIGNDKFAVALINEVVKSYLAATEPRVQDCSAYALQELLTIYNISESDSDGQSKKLWNEFPEHIQEILIPLLTSKYILTTDHNWSNLQKPIYGTKKGNTFKDWVSTWTNYLSSKVKVDGQAYKIFKSCSAVINFDIHIAIYILPYVVLHVLQDGGTEEINEVCQEINEVLQQSTRTDGKQKGSINHHMSSQTIFSILDYLTKWKYFMLSMKAMEAAKKKGSSGTSTSSQLHGGYKAVCQFLERIPQDKLSQVSFSCKAYTRALMHFELHLWDKTNLSKEELDFMQRIYVELDESDGVQGVAAIRQSPPSLQEQILTFSGRIGCQIELQTCFEQAIQCEPDEFSHHQGLLRCLMDLGQPSQALHHATGVIADRKHWASQLLPFQIEAAWKLGSWTALENYTKVDKTSRSWPVMLGRVLLSAKAKDEEDFLHQLQIVRQEQVGPLSAASFEMGSYQRGYEHIVRLHLLNEIEETMEIFLRHDKHDKSARQHLLSLWETSLKMMQSSFKVQEPVLTMRRTLMTLTQQEGHCDLDLDREIGHSWLCSAKIAHKTGYLQTAYSFLLQASEFNLPEFCLQKAKWHWEKGEHDQALSLLEREMSHHFNDISSLKADTSVSGTAKRKVYAKARLLYGKFCEETSKIESNAIVKQYKEVIDIAHDWEDGWFYLGKYFDKIMTALVDDKDDITKQGEFMIHVVKNLGTSLYYGNQFIYQSLPRLLSLWLDYGTSVVEQEKKMKGSVTSSASYQKNKSNLAKLNTMIGTFGRNLAPYQLFFTFSQLTSRICHAHPDVFAQLKAIIARLVVSYPRQALWLLMAVSKSSYQMRAKRCQEIFATARDMDSSLTKVIQDYIKLTERLLELCEKDITGSIASIDKNFRPLKRLLDDRSFTKILLPLQSSMTVTLPNMVDKHIEYNPFPGDIIYIHGFEDTIEVLPSLQKPKKITLKGSDGKLYVMMCKPKDDLRKDCRLMEFNGIVNKFLRKDPESRKRYLYIRTYTVIPLNEECGLIEWVNNTSGLRHILVKLYKEKNLYTSGSELKSMMPSLQSPRETKLQVFKQKLLPRHPPVFGEWFLRTFPDPTSWYNARLAYCKTVAVMSMVGYILGLGDRHGENILFDSTSGDCIHVDLNCLFNRGETFEWPEKVPFRLTHNLIHAMGPLKLEGIFRRACEVTLRVMRKESEPLMSMLKPFVYDPLVEWSKPSRGHRQSPTESGEITNEQGRVHVQNIEQRLQGILNRGTKRSGLALSVEGHVNHLIREATDDNNLCQMYIGWAAYL